MPEKPRYLHVVDMQTGEKVESVDVSKLSESQIDRCMRGMLINMNRDRYIVTDSAYEGLES